MFTSLPTSLHFFSASSIVLGLGRIRWEDLVPGPQEGGGLEGGFSLGHLLSSIAPLPLCMGHPLCGQPGCYISTLSSGHPANASSASVGWWGTVVVSGNPWELTWSFRKTHLNQVKVYGDGG